MLNFSGSAKRCFVYMPVRIERGEMLSLEGASEFELQAEDQAIWITLERESQDVLLRAGERFRITSHRHAVVSADHDVTIVVSGDAMPATCIEIARNDGERVAVYPSQDERERLFAIEPAPAFMARVFPALAAVARLIGNGGG